MASRDAPIRRKLMTMSLVTSGVCCCSRGAAFLSYRFATYRQTSIRQLSTLGEIMGRKNGADGFDTSGTRRKFSPRSKGRKTIVAACLYLTNGQIFARIPRRAATLFPPAGLRTPSLRGRLSRELHAVVQGAGQRIASAR